jgi:hypothetical protein
MVNVEMDINIQNKLEMYIKKNNIDDVKSFYNEILNLGFEYYIKKREMDYNTQINDIINNNPIINNINLNMTEITKNFYKPITKGNFGENIVNDYINKIYPNYDIVDTSHIPHSGDFHLNLNDINERVILEVKTYNEVVNKNEINKLINDMEYTGINYAVFISVCSKIVGKKNKIEWEIYKNKENKNNIIIFIPEAYNNIDNIQISITLLKSFIDIFNINSIDNNLSLLYLNKFTENSYKNINNSINELSYLKDYINKIKNNIYTLHDSISKQILELYHNFTIFDNEYNNKILLLQKSINFEFNNITSIITNNNNNDDIYLFLNKYIKNKNIYEILQIIISDLISNDFIFVIINNNELNIQKNNINHSKINILKTNINIVFNDGVQLKNININNWNKYKNLF